MSTPIVSAAAGLVRQYFMEGYYPTGEANISHSFTPVASLVKAMIIHSSVNTDGYVDKEMNYHEFNKYPNNYQGFGSVTLDNALFFSDSSNFILTVQTLDIESNKNHTIEIDAVISFLY